MVEVVRMFSTITTLEGGGNKNLPHRGRTKWSRRLDSGMVWGLEVFLRAQHLAPPTYLGEMREPGPPPWGLVSSLYLSQGE